MADTAAPIVCAFLQPIWNSTYRSVERQLKPICGLENEIDVLNGKWPGIKQKISNAEKAFLQAVLKFLENKTENEDNLKRVTNDLLPMLEGVYYNVTDVLDKWNTVDLMCEIDKSSKKVCFLAPTFYCSRLSLQREIAFEIEALKRNLQTFEEEAIDLDEHSNGQLIESLRLATSSYGLPKVYGREKEKEILMSKLNLNGSRTQGGSCVDKTIPILGMGGVGKTALAQLVFCDETVKNYFVRIWVSVPYKFDLAKILKTIIGQVNLEVALNVDAIQTLLDRVVETIKEKKLLLVLDDVWTVEHREWNKLIEAFGSSDPSSKILVTTQNYDVVRMMGAHSDSVIHLELLSADDCWKIVSRLASEADWNINGQLDQQLRDNFLWKCNGLPLLAHTLEFRLQSKNTKKCWNQDFRSDIADDDKVLFGPFFINYYGLSPVQRRCFSYCSVFPRNYEIENDDVMELWMSQDYFRVGLREKPEEEGLKCFEILTNRCLFQDSTKDYNGDIIKSKMHGLVYEFTQFLTKHEEARHFTLLLETSQAEIPNSMKERKKLRTLFVVRSETSSTPLNPLCCDLLVKLKCLRTLNLGYCNIEQLPEELDKLVHLRYLNLSGNSLRILPNALCYLLNLQTLRLKGCTQLQRLPEEMGNLASKFRHLHIEGCDSLKALPKEIERLKHLRTLDMFIIPSPDDPQSCEALKLEDLNQLEHIQGSIHIRQCRNLENANDLIETQNLVLNRRRNYHVNLKLNFEGSTNSIRTVDERAIFDALKPHSDVMSLEIRGCIGTSFPNWMDSLALLKRLVLCGCRDWEYLPPLGRLPSLESLQIESMDRVENVGLEFLAIASNERVAISFPKLKELKFSYLASWKKWEWTTSSGDENGSTIMPRLASLQVSGCESLEALPGFLRGIRNLMNLTIDGCTNLIQRCQEGVGADWDKIFRIPNIKIDGVPIRPRLVAESQASSSGRRATPTPDSTNRASTSRNTINIRRSLVSFQASTSGSRAIPTPGSSVELSTVMYSSNTFWYGTSLFC